MLIPDISLPSCQILGRIIRQVEDILPNPSLITKQVKIPQMIFISSKGLLEISQIKIILRSAENLTTKRGPFQD
jgi:hypothetical protein